MPTSVYYNIESNSVITRSATEDKWDRDDTHTDHRIVSASLTDSRGAEEVVDFDIEPNVAYFGVCYQASTGDSFGHSGGYYFRIVDLFKTEEEANEVAKRIFNEEENYGFSWLASSGIKRTAPAEWVGYFESLDWVGTFRVVFDGSGHGVVYNRQLTSAE